MIDWVRKGVPRQSLQAWWQVLQHLFRICPTKSKPIWLIDEYWSNKTNKFYLFFWKSARNIHVIHVLQIIPINFVSNKPSTIFHHKNQNNQIHSHYLPLPINHIQSVEAASSAKGKRFSLPFCCIKLKLTSGTPKYQNIHIYILQVTKMPSYSYSRGVFLGYIVNCKL